MRLRFDTDNIFLIKFFKIFIVVTGVLLIFVVPPFHEPDEPHHFLRIQQIASGEMFGTVDTVRMQMGQFLPKSLEKISKPFEEMIFQPDKKTSRYAIFELLKVLLLRVISEKRDVILVFTRDKEVR